MVTFKTEIIAFIAEHEIVMALLLALLAFAAAIPKTLVFGPALLLFMGLGAVLVFVRGDIALVWLAGAAGAFAADIFAYVLGRRRATKPVPTMMEGAPAEHANARALIERRGLMSLVISKLQGEARGLVPLEYGARLGSPAASFVVVSIISALIWSALYLLPAIVARALIA